MAQPGAERAPAAGQPHCGSHRVVRVDSESDAGPGPVASSELLPARAVTARPGGAATLTALARRGRDSCDAAAIRRGELRPAAADRASVGLRQASEMS